MKSKKSVWDGVFICPPKTNENGNNEGESINKKHVR
jgi:hypothetical protein